MLKTLNYKHYQYEWISAITLLLYFSPIFLNPEHVKFLIHDNIDSNLVWYKNLAESGAMFSRTDATIHNLMLGIPRNCYPSEWAIDRMMYLIFIPQWAYSINYITMHTIAFIGMRAFIKNISSNSSSKIYNLVALSFAILPFWPSGYLSVAGLPLLANTLIQIFKGKSTVWHWLLIAIFPMTGTLVFANMFSYPMFFIFFLFGVYNKSWNLNLRTLAPFVILFVMTILVENRILNLVIHGFDSNRSLDIPTVSEFMNFKGILGTSMRAFFFGHYHFHSMHVLIALTTLVFCIQLLKVGHINELGMIIKTLITIFALCLFMVFLDNYDLRLIFGEKYKRFELRFWVLFPFLWYAIFADVLAKMRNYWGEKLVTILLFIQIIANLFLLLPKDYFGSRYSENIFANTYFYSSNPEQETFKNYFRIDDFDQLKKFIPDYKLHHFIAIRINPEILQYNGLNTLEGYYSLYPKSKRLLVKNIDQMERKKKANDFERHSNRNYLYIHNLLSNSIPEWDYELLKQNNVNYIVSAIEYTNLKDQWQFIAAFNGINLYKIK